VDSEKQTLGKKVFWKEI